MPFFIGFIAMTNEALLLRYFFVITKEAEKIGGESSGQLRRSARISEKTTMEEVDTKSSKTAQKRPAEQEEQEENEMSFSKKKTKKDDPYAQGLKGYQPATSKTQQSSKLEGEYSIGRLFKA